MTNTKKYAFCYEFYIWFKSVLKQDMEKKNKTIEDP